MTTASAVDTAITPRDLVVAFFDAIRSTDIDAAFALVSDEVAVSIRPAGLSGGYEEARGFFEEVVTAFPDLLMPARRLVAFPEGRVLCEVTFEGTQAADFFG